MEHPLTTTSIAELSGSDAVHESVSTLAPADDDQRGHSRLRTEHLRHAANVECCGKAGLLTAREGQGHGVAVGAPYHAHNYPSRREVELEGRF